MSTMLNKQLPQSKTRNDGPAVGKEKQLTRLQKIITGEKSKAAKLKDKPQATLKAKAQGNRRNRKPGKLALMLQVPMDVFNEIAGHLAPLDLLHLARSSTGLRDLLMSKSSRPIWRTVLRALGAPECPPDINEPQFISLLFETFCQGCGAPRVKKVDYGLRIRLCPGCFSLNVVQGRKLAATVQGVTSKDYDIFRLCYFEGASSMGQLTRERLTNEGYARQKFFGPDFAEMIRKYSTFAPGSVEQKKFVQRQKELVKDVYEHVVAIEGWLKQLGTRTASETRLKVLSRKASILKRLKELGYSDEDLNDSCMSWDWNQMLLQPRELTERIWQNIFPHLKRIIMTRRENKVERARAPLWRAIEILYKAFCSKWETLNGKPPIMAFQDLKQLPEVRSLVENNELIPSISEERWRVVEDLLPAAIHDLETLIKKDCAALITSARQRAGLPPLFTDDTDTSVNIILAHASSFILQKDYFFASLKTFEGVASNRQARASDSYIKAWQPITSQCPNVLKLAFTLIRSLNLADNVTMAEMEKYGKAFVCKCCDRRPSKKRTWKELVEHFLRETKWFERMTERLAANPDIEMRIIDSHNIDASVKLAELDLGEENTDETIGAPTYFSCLICNSTFPYMDVSGSRACVEAHIRTSHGKACVEACDISMPVY